MGRVLSVERLTRAVNRSRPMNTWLGTAGSCRRTGTGGRDAPRCTRREAVDAAHFASAIVALAVGIAPDRVGARRVARSHLSPRAAITSRAPGATVPTTNDL